MCVFLIGCSSSKNYLSKQGFDILEKQKSNIECYQSDKKRLKKFITILQIYCIKDICKKELKSKKNISLSNFDLEMQNERYLLLHVAICVYLKMMTWQKGLKSVPLLNFSRRT